MPFTAFRKGGAGKWLSKAQKTSLIPQLSDRFYDKVNGVTNEDRSIKCGGNGYDRKDHGQYEQPHMRFCVS